MKPNNIPKNPQTLGEHLLVRRLTLKLYQKDVAKLLGTDNFTLMNWEKQHSQPAVRFIPGIIAFLGCDPQPRSTTIGGRIRQRRHRMGLSIAELAKQLQVDPTALGSWERNQLILHRNHRRLVANLLGEPAETIQSAMATIWGAKHHLHGKRRKPAPWPPKRS